MKNKPHPLAMKHSGEKMSECAYGVAVCVSISAAGDRRSKGGKQASALDNKLYQKRKKEKKEEKERRWKLSSPSVNLSTDGKFTRADILPERHV